MILRAMLPTFQFEASNLVYHQVQGVAQLLKQSDWAQIQDFKWYHHDDYIYWKEKR